jgi:hypothetical protein
MKKFICKIAGSSMLTMASLIMIIAPTSLFQYSSEAMPKSMLNNR